MPNPINDEPEWVELHNNSNKTISLSNLKIGDSRALKDLPKIDFYPFSYIIISKDTLSLKIRRNIPGNARLIEIILPGLNNTIDQVRLFDDEIIIDSIYYDMSWGETGFSFERVNPELPANSNENLLKSKSETGATAGYINSNQKDAYDIDMKSITLKDNNLFFKILNNGLKEIDEYNFTCFVDINQDRFMQKNEILIDDYEKNIPVYDSVNLVYNFDLVTNLLEIFGSFELISFVSTMGDDYNKNDTASINIYITPPKGSVLINEIMFDVSKNNSEFIELYNTSDFNINLKNWAIKDRGRSLSKSVYIENYFLLNKKSYCLIAWDSTLINFYKELENEKNIYISKNNISLNNSDDEIDLIDANGNSHDYLEYFENWHNSSLIASKNVSLEKINPSSASNNKSNWTSSGNSKGATPGRENSVFREIDDKYDISAVPNPFSPYDNSANSKCKIEYKLPFMTSLISSKIFDTEGTELKAILTAKYSSNSGVIFWDGTNNDGTFLEPGPYIFYLEAIDTENNEVFIRKMVLIIGKN